ncbi:MAG: flagellar biosynthesis anti-sigma factor FlgM [Treponema sp.]|jgi:negative regulator of flagellin synthesis FlgM|nr:flagellar biosynthesis anti-sigma factor FlgM [Treponema sp.]
MTIDRIAPLDPIQPGKQSGRADQAGKSKEADSIKISSEAAEKADFYRTIELVDTASDVREDRIAELKAKINDPSYLNDTIIKATADQIMNAFGL